MSPHSSSFFFLSLGGIAPGGLPRTIHEVIKTVVQGGAGQNREEKKMAEICVPKEPGGLDEAEPPLWGNGGEGRALGSWGSPGLASSLQGGERVWSP